MLALYLGTVLTLVSAEPLQPPRLDASSMDAVRASVARMHESLGDERKMSFALALDSLFRVECPAEGQKQEVANPYKLIDGMTAEQIIAIYQYNHRKHMAELMKAMGGKPAARPVENHAYANLYKQNAPTDPTKVTTPAKTVTTYRK